jgi:hypothetical protein
MGLEPVIKLLLMRVPSYKFIVFIGLDRDTNVSRLDLMSILVDLEVNESLVVIVLDVPSIGAAITTCTSLSLDLVHVLYK